MGGFSLTQTEMNYITINFESLKECLDGTQVTALGLYGLLLNVLKKYDSKEADWLHAHPFPKPFTLVPLFADHDTLHGLRLASMTERVSNLLTNAWTWVKDVQILLELGDQRFTVKNVAYSPDFHWEQLVSLPPSNVLALRFLSPTAFKQGPGHLPLPLPINVFHRPVCVWQSYAPTELTFPDNWLAWCGQNVFVKEYKIETIEVQVRKRELFTGFVGDVLFIALDKNIIHLQAWQALGQLVAFCGVGHKTTMGMGIAEKLIQHNNSE